MTKFLILAASIAIAGPALAAPAATIDFVRDGEHYVGTVRTDAEGKTLVGRNETTGAPFTLRVVGSDVTGTYDERPVAFTQTVQTASR